MSSRRNARGLTLVEVLIVVVLIALLTGSAVMGPGVLKSTRMRAAATLIVSAVRLAQNRTNASGRPVRLVLDLDKSRVSLEEANSVSFAREKGSTTAGAELATEAEKKARSETELILEGPRAPRPKFKLLPVLSEPGEPTAGRSLGAGVQIASVETDHDEEPVTEGRAFVYVWPGGLTERSAIRLKRSGSAEEGITVLISALTGRASIVSGKAEFPPPRDDPEGSGFGRPDEEER